MTKQIQPRAIDRVRCPACGGCGPEANTCALCQCSGSLLILSKSTDERLADIEFRLPESHDRDHG